jgi:hypothetical protein
MQRKGMLGFSTQRANLPLGHFSQLPFRLLPAFSITEDKKNGEFGKVVVFSISISGILIRMVMCRLVA